MDMAREKGLLKRQEGGSCHHDVFHNNVVYVLLCWHFHHNLTREALPSPLELFSKDI